MPITIPSGEAASAAVQKMIGEPGQVDKWVASVVPFMDVSPYVKGLRSILTGSLTNHFIFMIINNLDEDLQFAWESLMTGKCANEFDPVIPKGRIGWWLCHKDSDGVGGTDMILVYKGARSQVYHGFRAGQRMFHERIGMYTATSKNLESLKAKMINDFGEDGRDDMQVRYPVQGKYVYVVARAIPEKWNETRHCYFRCVKV